jgi:hypothetical protein
MLVIHMTYKNQHYQEPSDEQLRPISEILDDYLWIQIRRESEKDEALKKALEHVKILYYLKKS